MTAPMKKRRSPPFSIRLNEDERAKLEESAGGMPIASYVKSVVLADDAPRYRARRKPPVEDQRLIAEVLARLGQTRTASNLNQIARAANRGVLLVDDDLATELRQACVDVAWMRAALIEALGLKPGG